MVMELIENSKCDNASLMEWLMVSGPLGMENVWKVITQTASALLYLQQKCKVVWADLDVEHILIGQEGF